MPGLTLTIQEILENQREEEWRRDGVPDGDIKLSGLNGMDARDMRAFRDFSYCSPNNPGLKAGDHFAAFHDGLAEYLQNPMACAAFYARFGLSWPYDGAGRFFG